MPKTTDMYQTDKYKRNIFQPNSVSIGKIIEMLNDFGTFSKKAG